MAVNINASTSTGFEITPDTSGDLNLQSGGSTKVAVTSSGVALTGLTKGSLPTGSVLQVVCSNPLSGTGAETSSTSWIDTGLTLNITPLNASNKILVVLISGDSYRGLSYPFGKLQMHSSLGPTTYTVSTYHLGEDNTVTNHYGAAPSSAWNHSITGWTSGAITYKVQMASGNGVYWQYGAYGNSLLYAMEIAA